MRKRSKNKRDAIPDDVLSIIVSKLGRRKSRYNQPNMSTIDKNDYDEYKRKLMICLLDKLPPDQQVRFFTDHPPQTLKRGILHTQLIHQYITFLTK